MIAHFSKCSGIEAISLHFEDGSGRLFLKDDVIRLFSALLIDMSIFFAVVNFENRAPALILHDIQAVFDFLEQNFKNTYLLEYG